MALSVVPQYFLSRGNLRSTICKVTGDSSYVTGGYTVPVSQWGLGVIVNIDCSYVENQGTNTTLYDIVYNPSSGKVQFFTAPNAELGNGNSASAYIGTVEAIGY